MRTIAITGGTGFVGRHLISHFLSRGWSVRALARNPENLPHKDQISTIKGSLDHIDRLEELIEDAKVVAHCAGSIKARASTEFFNINSDGVETIARVCAESPTRPKLINLSSRAARAPELSDYAASKYAGEERLRRFADRLDGVSLRAPIVYGPGDTETLKILKGMKHRIAIAPRPKSTRIGFIFIEDLCAAIEALAQTEISGVHTVDAGDPSAQGHTWPEIADIVGDCLKRKVYCIALPPAPLRLAASVSALVTHAVGGTPMLTTGKINEFYCQSMAETGSDLTNLTGWKPTVTIIEGMAQTCEWYQEQGLL
jgi:nucleoside-diphosphate-sugar epimerase